MTTKRKFYCVIGLGTFGAELATTLVEDGEVLAIDISQAAVDEIAPKVHQAVCLDARDPQALARVVSKDFSLAVVAIGDHMEASILCTLHLERIGVQAVWVKAVNDDHATILEHLGADRIIFPEREAARRLGLQAIHPNLMDFLPLGEGYQVMEITPPSWFVGSTLEQLDVRSRYGVFVIAIKRNGSGTVLFLPGPHQTIGGDDVLVVIGEESCLRRLHHAREPSDLPRTVLRRAGGE